MSTPQSLAQKLLEVLPAIVHRIRSQARVAVKGKITLPQFRILASIERGLTNVGQIAESQGVAQPTMSKMVDGLVNRGLVKRSSVAHDRRQIQLSLTQKGGRLLKDGISLVQIRLSQDLATLGHRDRDGLSSALNQIEKCFKGIRNVADGKTSTQKKRSAIG